MNHLPYRLEESEPGAGPFSDLRLVADGETVGEGWLDLGREPLQVLIDGRRCSLRVAYRQGGPRTLTSLAVLPQHSVPERRTWSRAHSQDFRSAAKDASAEAQALWLRRDTPHPPLRRLAIISGQWSDMDANDRVELRSRWKLVSFDFSDTLAGFVFLGFSIR